MTPPGTTLLICLSVCLSVYITNVAGEPPFFIVPSTSYDSESVTESIAPDSVVLTLVAQDANADILTLSIKSQSPESPAFYYDNATDELRVPADGLDAETSQSFTFVFSVTDGNQTVDSVPFTLTVTDVNEFGPVFSPDSYNGTATDGDLPGTVVLTVTATDPDVNATLTYSIAAGNTLDTFSIDGTTGDVKIINAANLDSSTTPSYTLTILASDGSSNTTAQATITVSGASTTDRPTTTQTPCTIYCQNGGSCTLLPSGESSCDCADGFSGDLCEIEDFCVTDPCSDNAVDCKPLTIGRQCICPVGLKGDNCAEDDPVVTCKDSEKQLYLEKFPSDEDRSICLTVDGTTDSDICYNPGERISYQLAVSGEYFNSSVIQDKFCVKYTGNNPAQESICVSVIAFEEDDVILRPWINATSNICFIFNTLPVFAGPSQVKVGFQSSETSKVISLSITDEDDHQSHSAIIKAVSPVTYFTYFAIVNDVDLQVTKPQEITVPVIVQVTITITDNGVPALSSTEVLEVEILPVSSLDCRVEPPPPLLLHMPDEQLPDTEQELGRVSCPNAGNDSGLSFDTRAAVGPVVVRDDGTIVYDPDLRDTQPADGDFNITITARILQPVQLSRDIDVVIIADDFLPNCGQAEAMFNETSLIGDCFDLFVCTERANVDEICDDNSDLFNASCERDSLSGQTNVKLCVADSLVNQVANIQILVTVSNTYGMTEVSVPVTILDVNNPPEIIVPPGQQAYQVPENLEAGYEVATLEVTDPDLQQLQSTEALSVTLTGINMAFFFSKIPGSVVKWPVKLLDGKAAPAGQTIVYCRSDNAEFTVGIDQLEAISSEHLKEKGLATLKKKKLQSTTIVFEEDLQWARDNTKTLNKKNLKRKQTQVPRVDAKKKKCKGKSRNDAKNASRKSQMSDSHDSHDEGLMENELDKTLKENLESSDMEDASRKSQMSDSHDSHDEGLMENELDKTLKENLESSDMEDASRKSQMSDSHDSHDEGLMENELDKTLKENLESSDMEDASRKSQMSDSHDSHDEGLMENELDKTLKENLESSDMEDASRKSQMSDSHDSHDEGLMENELDKTLKENLESSDMEDASRKSQMSDSHDSHDEGLMENELDKTLKENLESSDMEDASRKSQMSDSHDSHDEGLMENELDKTLKENLESSDMEETDEDLYSSGSEWKDEQAASSDEETGGESVVEESECEDDKSDVYPYLEVNSLDKGRHYSSIGAPSAIKSPEKQTASLPNYRILSEEEKHYCVKNREIFIKQTTKSEKSKHGRCYDIVHSCLYCGKLMSNIQKHLENQHKNENDVKEILKLKKDKEMVINDLNIKKQVGQIISSKQCLIRNKGDHEHNLLVLKSKKGELLLSRRRKGDFVSESYGGCPECLEWLVLRENYNQHRQTCPAKTKSTVTEAVMQNLIFQGKIVSTASKQMQMEVFPIMHNDDITTTAITDPLIVALGEVHFMSSIGNRLKRKNYASYRMRLAARLLHLVRKETDSDSATMTESLNVENFDTFAKCAILACGENADSEMEHPSVAIKIGFDVTKLVAAKIGYAAKERNDVEYKEGKRFQSLLQREWKLKVRKQATVLLDERRFNKQFDLPDPEDVAKLAKYLVEKLDEFSSESICSAEEYRHLAMLTEARLLLYNRRRPGELEALTIETYRKRSRGVSETDLSLRSELTVLEKKLLNSQELLELRGKGNKRVPVILPQEVRRPLKLLVNQTVRQKGAVCPDNKYVFGTSGMEPLRAGAALDVVKYDAGLKYPLRILATNLRKHTATISQVMGLKDNELRWLVNHMGHTEKVHLTHYRATSGLIERLDIAKIMLMQEQGSVSRFAGVELHDINFQDITDLDEEPPAAAPVASVSSDAESAFDEDIEENDLQVEQTNKKKNRTEDVSEATDIPFSASLNDDQSAVSIVTTAPLDYNLINSYQLKLTVTDRAGLSDSVVLTVTVTDVNEAPLCSRTTVEASVSVRNKIGDTVVAIQCSDPDANDVLVYSLQGSEDLFAVDSSSGAVTVRNSLAGLTGTNSLTFYVIVRDKGGLTVNVTVTVTINNSFPPICRGQSYSHSLSENTDANVCFRISINCTDEVTNELLTYAIVSGNGTDNFKLSTEITSNSNVQLCTKVNLKHLYGSYMIGINVSSSYGDTQVQVTVNVQDVNDPPQFALALYRVDVAENTAVGLPVVTVSAIDRDSGAAGIITFSSSDIDNSPYFTLNSNTGTISIKSTVDADVLVNGRIFNYTVEAADSTQQPMSATTTVQITVIDVNDNAPVCTGASATVLLQLTDPVGTLVRTLSCSDGDVSGLYNRIGYRLKDTTQQVFTVNSTGHIVLNQALAREVSTYTVEVEAYDLDKPDDPTFDFLVTITVNIITAIPPICDPSSVVQTLAETEPVGFCLNNEVICRDPTGGTVTVVSESGSGSEFMEIRTNSGTSQLGLNACIKKSLRNNFQQYTLQVEVTNGLATAVVSWTFTVTNINEAPYFLEPKVEKFIDEGFVNPNEAILSLSVDDPDENFDNAAFKIKSVTAVLTDRTNFDDEILFVPLARQFLAIRPLNATVRKLYTYNLTVEDGQGLYDLATVEFRINDINSAPVCPDTRPDVRTDILASVGSQLYKVFCYDTDIDPLNTRLTYRITSGDPDNYLNVTADGRVLVAKKFPRIRLYGTSTVNLTIEVTDQGTPPYVTNVYLGVYVNNQIPSECNPVVTPPDIWVVDKCANLTMDCTDPTIPDSTDHLAYTPEGSYTQGFKLTNPTPGVFRLCYLQTKGGNYEITVKVENGLMAKRYTETIEVQYLAATPVFSSTEYQETVTENFAAGNVIVTVVATSAKLIGSIVYHVIGDSSTAGWASYFSLNQSSGEIKTLKPLGNLADREIRLRIEAEDDGSKLRSSTQVQITVTDINEAPQCTVTPDVDIDVTAAVGTQVVVFNCSDPDVKPEYKSLTYGITGAGVQGVFMLSPVASPVSIVTARKLNVTTPTYILQLSVTDRGTPQLSFSQTFTVTVSLLPPALTVEIVELTYESIKVRWSYADREDFYSVTDSFQVIVSPVQGAVIESQVQGAGIRQLNITGLVAETRYSLVVKANTSYGIRESVPLSFITPVVPILSPIVFTIHVKSKNYTHLYRDPESQLYFQLKQEVLTNMEEKLNGTQGYAGTHLKGFRPANSIYIDLIVFVNQSGNVNDMIEELRQIVQTGWLAVDLALNSSFFYASLGNGYITIEPIVYEPQPIYNGTDAVLTCNILTVGYLVTDTFVYQWTYKGKILQQTSQSRYKMTNDTLAIYENKQSKLQISPMLNDNEGVYGCIVGDRAGAQTASANVTISVLSQPLVTLTPRSETVNQGDQVNLMCAVFVDDDNMFRQFVWYKNGNLLQDGPGLDVSVGDLNQTLTISSIQQTAEYGCQGDGPAGKGPRVLSYIGVIPRDPVGVILCEMTTETRNSYQIRWPRSVAGTTAIEKCPSVYIGEVSRVCDQSGQWQRSVYNCQSKSIVQIQEEVKAVQDGTGTKNLSVSISDLAGETNRTLFEGDLSNALGTLNTVVEIVTDPLAAPVVSTAEAEVDTSNYLRIASNLIENRPPWESRLAQNEEGAIAVPKAVEGYLKGRIQQLSPSGVYFKTFTEENVYAEVGKGERSKYEFPDRSQVGTPAWINNSSTRIEIPAESIKDHASLGYSSSFYKQLPAILDPKFINDGSIDSTTRHINADTVTFQVMGDIGTIDPPARIYFQHYLANYSDPQCVSWDIERNAYVTDGCSMVTTSDTMTECACRHFTNFAILMSPGKTPAADVKALSIISAVGCALSIFFLLLTIILHLIVWRLVKSDRAILLMNLCVALIVAYIIFVAGVGRAENEDVCTAVALLLHFFYLAVFFLMLAYGIEIGVTVIYVFVTRSRIKWMLPLAWGIPLVIVIISAAATKLKGYGNESFCWLSIEDGLLWAFVGPAAFVILFNFIIVIAVIRKMFKSAAMLTKTDKDKAKTGVRSLCVLLPILGLTWVFGIFSVNEDLVVFQYIFAVCNSLQGVFIFIFHCALSKQLRDAYKQRSARKKSLQSFDKSLNKNVHSSDTSTGFYSDSSKPNNDSGFSSETTNPFLQADQQMNKMMDKNKTSVAYDNNKLNVNKDRRDGGGVDLEDVKISNILRESEVMGGTTGISSILQAQSTSLPDTRRVTDDEKGGGLRPSGMSSHKYDYIDSADVSKPASQKYDYVDAPSTSKPSYTENAVYIQAETERPKSYEALPGPYVQKFGVSTDSLGASNDSKKDKNLTDKQKDKIYGSNERGKEGSRKAKDVAVSPRVEKGVASKSQLSKSSKSSRSDEDYEVRIMEPYHRTTHVYMPYGRGIYRSLERLRGDMQPSSSAQNISSISTALPTITYDEYQAKTKKPDSPRKQDSSLKRKDKGGSKTKKPKDRSKAYEYSYESTYLGDRSRHSSLENMNMQHYTPYAQMPGMGGYGTGRPAHQAQHWDQYQQQQQRQQPQQPRQQPRQQPQQPRQQPQQPYYRGDYW